MVAWLAGVAAAQTCDTADLRIPGEATSVAWVSPLGRRSGGRWLWVVPTADLRELAEDAGTVGRTLQRLGLRRKGKDPSRRYKVVVFDVERSLLCRPVPELEEGAEVAGVPVCDDRRSPDPDRNQACGWALDRSNGDATVELFRAEWGSLASAGFCVLPMDRFVADAGR